MKGMVKNTLVGGLLFSVCWGLFLGVFVRLGSYEVKVEYDNETITSRAPLSRLFAPPEMRSMAFSGDWNPPRAGDTLQIAFVGLATGSKSTILGGYSWVQWNQGVEVSRGSRGKILFWLLFALAVSLPLLLSLVRGRRRQKEIVNL
jgi:hypothetical protein